MQTAELHAPLPADLKSEKIVSDRHKFVWVGIPKVATRSFLEVFVRNPAIDTDSRIETDELWQLSERLPIGHYFKFTFVRNPWARVVSCYLNKIANPDPEKTRSVWGKYPGLEHHMPFDRFVDFLINNPYGNDNHANRHWISQHRFICSRGGQILVDFIGFCEKLQEEFDIACGYMGLPHIELPVLNTRQGWKPEEKVIKQADPFYYRDYYTPKTREKIRSRYETDIQVFKYTF